MMQCIDPIHQPTVTQQKELWRYLLDSPANMYNAQVLIKDVEGGLYFTTDPIVVIDREASGTIKFTAVTRTHSLKNMSVYGYLFVCKDVKGWLPPKYEMVRGDGEEGDIQIKIDQYFQLSHGEFSSPVVMVNSDTIIPTVTITLPRGLL